MIKQLSVIAAIPLLGGCAQMMTTDAGYTMNYNGETGSCVMTVNSARDLSQVQAVFDGGNCTAAVSASLGETQQAGMEVGKDIAKIITPSVVDLLELM